MTTRRTLLWTAIAAVLLLAAIWRIAAGRVDGIEVPAPAADLAPGPIERSAPLEAGGERPAPRSPETAIDAASLPPLHVPDYGPDLARPTARARFDLRDARGAPLEGAVLEGVELWRKVGEEWVGHPAALEPDDSRVICEGAGGSGLPPGEYELDLRAGPYGALREPFTLARGDSLERTLSLPHWRRIIRLAIQDNLGRPLARLTQAPEYAYEVARADGPSRRVLGVLPEESAPAFGDPAPVAFHPLFHSRRGWEAYYETDGGAYFVRVFAGLPARVKIDVEAQRYGRDAIVLESDFTGEEWKGHPIVLEPVPGLHEKMDAEAWVDVNPDDPGSRSLLAAPILPPPPRLDPKDVSDMLSGRIRMIVQVDTPIPVRMESESGTPHRAGGDIVDRTLWETDDLWFMDVMLNPGGGVLPTSCGFTDDFLFRAEVPVLPVRPLPEITPEMWGKTSFEYRARLEARPVVIDVVPPTPTLAAYARIVQIGVAHGQYPDGSIAIGPDASGRFRVRTGLSADKAGTLLERASVRVDFCGEPERGHFTVWHILDDAARTSLVRGSLALDGSGDGLVLRVVNGERNGIPGVAGRIVTAVSVDFAEGTRVRLESDSDGYLLADEIRLVPGKRYVLFLSGPGVEDRRIDFEAAPGITDLGVVRLGAP